MTVNKICFHEVRTVMSKLCQVNYVYRSCERTTPIWFTKLITGENEMAESFLDARRVMLEFASTNCHLYGIHIGRRITAKNLADHHRFFEDKFIGLSPCLPQIFSCYRLIAFKVGGIIICHYICVRDKCSSIKLSLVI